jgi:hypothetical protein
MVRIGVRLGMLAAVGLMVAKVLQRRNAETAVAGAPTWPPVTPRRPGPTPEPARAEPIAAPAPASTPSLERAWVEPSSDGLCPQTHPIRAKLSSKIFHLPGMFAYERTHPDRCYAAEDDAVSDGFRKAKR